MASLVDAGSQTMVETESAIESRECGIQTEMPLLTSAVFTSISDASCQVMEETEENQDTVTASSYAQTDMQDISVCDAFTIDGIN